MLKYTIITHVLFTLFLGFNSIAFASDQGETHKKHEADNSHHDHKDGKTPHWAKSLSKKQKVNVDNMHHELDRLLEPLKENEKSKQKELNTLTIQDNVSLSKIYKAIDELMNIKNKILRNRHEHLIEMRQILNDEQRVSYDKAILKRHKIK